VETEGSLPCSQQPSTGPYPESDHPSPYHSFVFLPRSILLSYIHIRLGFPSCWFPSTIPTNNLFAFLVETIHATCRAHLNFLDLTILITIYGEQNYEIPHYSALSNFLSYNFSLVEIFSSASSYQTPSVYVPPSMSETKFRGSIKARGKLKFCVL
jgi:hypothetical protein